MSRDDNTLLCCGLCVAICLFFCTVLGAYVFSLSEELHNIQTRCAELEQKSRYYDEVMVTYEFFNDRWSRAMMGEDR